MDKVKCIETGNIFRSANEAARCMNIAPQAIYQALNKGCAAKSYHFIIFHNEEQAAILENEITHHQQQKKERKMKNFDLMMSTKTAKKDELESMLVDLFKNWYLKKYTIQECSAMSGYSVGYLYQRFRAEKVMRGLV